MFAGDISPIDVITHMPLLCEEGKVPYVYVPSKEVHRCRFCMRFLRVQDLGTAGQTKRPTSVVLIKPAAEGYDELRAEIAALPSPF